MVNELCLDEWKIERIWDDEDRFGNPIKRAEIMGHALGTQIPLYDHDLELLQMILGCTVKELKGKSIIAVSKDRLVKAIGYQGLYIPLNYWDNSSKILSENELCELLDCYDIVRVNKNGDDIISYELPEINYSYKK